MKNLLTRSVIALLMLSLFAVSCKKGDTLIDTLKKLALKVKVSYKDDKGAPQTSDGDVKNGGLGVYVFVPELPAGYENCNGNGVWTYTIVGDPKYPKGVTNALPRMLQFAVQEPGTYTVTINYTCGSTTISKTITIVVK